MTAESGMNQLYAMTVDSFPSAVFFVGAAFEVVMIIGMSVLYFFIAKYERNFGDLGTQYQ